MPKANNNKSQAILIILTGLIVIACGLYIYFVAHTIYPNSDSNRVQDLNWLLKTFGKTGTAVLFSLIGFIILFAGVRQLKK